MNNLFYVTADISSKLAGVRTDILNIAFKSNFFDVVLCNHVLEHVIDDRKAMRELHRILKPGGWAILQSPMDFSRKEPFEDFNVVLPQDRERLFGQSDHVRIYGLDYKERLLNAGFSVKIDGFLQNLKPSKAQRYGLPIYEDIYFCRKEGLPSFKL
jgi:SAM-dependent methyltransferase